MNQMTYPLVGLIYGLLHGESEFQRYRTISFVRKWKNKDDEDTAHPNSRAYEHLCTSKPKC